MTKIVFYKKNELFVGFEISGHTNFAISGQDILCSAVSALSQGTCLGITQVLKIKTKIKRDDKKGYLKLDLAKNTQSEIKQAQVLLETLERSLFDISIGNEKFIKMEVV